MLLVVHVLECQEIPSPAACLPLPHLQSTSSAERRWAPPPVSPTPMHEGRRRACCTALTCLLCSVSVAQSVRWLQR